jgi:phosphoenolpyruvate carboxylase
MTEIIDFKKMGIEFERTLKIKQAVEVLKDVLPKAISRQGGNKALLKIMSATDFSYRLTQDLKMLETDAKELIEILKREKIIKFVCIDGKFYYQFIS